MRRTSKFVDRAVDMSTLHGAIARARKGYGSFVVIEGPPGIGKTRLLAELRSHISEDDSRTLSARCSQLDHEMTFGLVRQLFESAVASTSDSGALFSGAASQARNIFADDLSECTAGLDFGVLHGLFWLTVNLCQEAPYVVLVDDIQWCDEPSLRFLAYLQHRLADLPIVVVVAARSGESKYNSRLLDHIAVDPSTQTIRLGPISEQSGLTLLADQLGDQAHKEFLRVCYRSSAGNPLLLAELGSALLAEGIEPVAHNVHLVPSVTPRSVTRWVRNRLRSIGSDALEVASAVSVLGDFVDVASASSVAGLSHADSFAAAEQLCAADILRWSPRCAGHQLEFIHPLVREAVYDGLRPIEASHKHARAAQTLSLVGRDIEAIAAHLLLTHDDSGLPIVPTLRFAARAALSRGAPDGAVAYLKRSLREVEEPAEREALLAELGTIAQMVDLPAAATYLEQAISTMTDVQKVAETSGVLAGVLLQMGRIEGAVDLLEQVAASIPDSDVDVRFRVKALLGNVPILEPRWNHLAESLHTELERAHGLETVGARMVDAVTSYHDAVAGRPHASDLATTALADDVLIREVTGEGALVCAWLTLLSVDDSKVIDSLDNAVAYCHQQGSIRGLAPAYALRGLAWLWRGSVVEADADLMEARTAIDAADINIGRLFAGPFLAQVRIAQGRLSDAQGVLRWAGVGIDAHSRGPAYFGLGVQAQVLRLQGHAERAMKFARRCGEHYEMHEGVNPALAPWRSEMALCLHELGRVEEARDYADEELLHARNWSSARALGRALRVAGTVTPGEGGTELLRESVEVLSSSQASLEHAESLIYYGQRLRLIGRTADARRLLRAGLEQVEVCGGQGLISVGRRELSALGVRPRRLAQSGPRSLTPSERRIVELVVEGRTNRDIAQALFVTPKTVEIHLTAAFKKLNVRARNELKAAMER